MSENYKTSKAEVTKKVNADGVECIEVVSTILQDNALGRIQFSLDDLNKMKKLKFGHSIIL